MNNFEIRSASLNDVKLMFEWAAEEKWGMGVDDPVSFHIGDPTGFFFGYLNNEPVTCICAIRYPDQQAFIGMYLVKAGYRGQGYGLKVWEKAREYLAGYNIGLDGVMAQEANYAKSGFKTAYYHIHFKGKPTPSENMEIISARDVPFNLVLDYNRPFFPAPRPAFLTAYYNMPTSRNLVMMANGKVTGFGSIRKCQGGYCIAPLLAESVEIAEKLFTSLCQFVDEGFVYLDVPEIHAAAVNLAGKFNLQPEYRAARMYTGAPPVMEMNKIFGVTSMTMG